MGYLGQVWSVKQDRPSWWPTVDTAPAETMPEYGGGRTVYRAEGNGNGAVVSMPRYEQPTATVLPPPVRPGKALQPVGTEQFALTRDVAPVTRRRPARSVVTSSSYDLPEIHVPQMPATRTTPVGAGNGEVVEAGMFSGLLSNPLLLVGIGVGLWFMLGRK